MYASLYGYWIFLVIGLHWFCMFLWLISPKNVFHGERISKPRKAYLSALIAFVYIFAYVNLQEVNHRQKMVTFYVVMILENALLVTAWLTGNWYDKPDDWYTIPLLVFGLFSIGLIFMLLYYRYFHVRRLGYEAGGRLPQNSTNNNYCISCNGICECDDSQVAPANTKLEEIHQEAIKYDTGNNENNKINNSNRYHQHSIPGVFNCRFSNPVIASVTTKRKKKKPTTFVPPPTMSSLTPNLGPTPIPFWRKPLPNQHNHQGGSSENEGSSVGSRVNIHQKLQEKKQKQLAELKIIEEEIKQGKLVGPNNNSLSATDETFSSLPRQPIPTTKKHVEPICWPPPSPDITDITDLNSYTKNINEFQINLSEINRNTSNLNKFTNYKQNIGINSTLNNLNTLNDLNYNLNNSLNRLSSSPSGLNNNQQNIQALTDAQLQPSVNNTRITSNKSEYIQEMDGLSPILGSDESGSVSQLGKIVMRQLPKKSYNLRMNQRKENEQQRNNTNGIGINRVEYENINRNLYKENNQSSPGRELYDLSRLKANLIENTLDYVDERNGLNTNSRIYDLLPPNSPNNNFESRLNINELRSNNKVSALYLNRNQRFTSPSNESIYNLRLYNDSSSVTPNNSKLGESRVILCTNNHHSDLNNRRTIQLSEDDCTDEIVQRLNTRDIINLNGPSSMEYYRQINNSNNCSNNSNTSLKNPLQSRYVPYHIVPPPKTKQNSNIGPSTPTTSITTATETATTSNLLLRSQINRSKTPEILLAPHYLDNTRVYYDWGDRAGQSNIYRLHDQHLILSNDDNNSTLQRHISNLGVNNEPNSVSDNENINEHDYHADDNNYKSGCRVSSDIDSQISLPRSYTLPREFKYYRRNRIKKNTRIDHFIASTNSSDGDVDSGDDNDTDDSVMISIKPPNLPLNQNSGSNQTSSNINNALRNKMVSRRPYAYRNQVKHETKL